MKFLKRNSKDDSGGESLLIYDSPNTKNALTNKHFCDSDWITEDILVAFFKQTEYHFPISISWCIVPNVTCTSDDISDFALEDHLVQWYWSDYFSMEGPFKCVDKDHKAFSMMLYRRPTIRIKQEDTICFYSIKSSNSNTQIELTNKFIVRDKTKLSFKASSGEFILEKDEHTFTIHIYEDKKNSTLDSNQHVCGYPYSPIEQYLLSMELSFPIQLKNIFSQLQSLDFKPNSFFVSYEKDKRLISSIRQEKGKVTRYSDTSSNGNWTSVCSDGSWEYKGKNGDQLSSNESTIIRIPTNNVNFSSLEELFKEIREKTLPPMRKFLS